MIVAILGRQPEFGIAELESVIGSSKIELFSNNIALIKDAGPINYQRFGSVIKFADVKANIATSNPDNLQKVILEILQNQHPDSDMGKLKLGLSSYGQTLSIGKLNSMALSIKKALKNKGYSVRVVPNKAPALNSAHIIHNKLASPSGSEVLILQNGKQTLLATTLYEQDIEAYAARDQARPKRDARVGMLPPKLAQTIINLATGKIENYEERISNNENSQNSPKDAQSDDLSLVHGRAESRSKAYDNVRRASNAGSDKVISQEKHKATSSAGGQDASAIILLDPFCGTGVILQEALLMGLSVYGTDLEPRMVEYSQDNLNWLVSGKDIISGKVKLEVGDATDHKWQPIPQFIAAETYLGRPLTDTPAPDELNKLVHSVNTLHKKALENIAKQIPTGTRLCLAVPAWRSKNRFISLPVLDQLGKIGYNQLEFKLLKTNNLIYARADQIVGRQLVVLTKA